MFIVPIFFIRFVFWAARGARRRAALLGAAAALACAPTAIALQDEAAAGGGGRDAFYYSLLASFASAHGRHDEATAIFARLAAQSGDDFYHRRAVEESIRAKRLPAAIENARLWRDKFPAARAPRQTLAELLTLAGRLREARPLLARLLAAGEQSPHDLFKQLAQAPDRGAGRALLSSLLAQRDDAESLLARIRFALIEQDAAAAAALLARARASFPYRVEWALADAAAAATQGGFAEALAALESYRADGCPGAPNACLLPQLIYAYEAFRNGRELARRDRRSASAFGRGDFRRRRARRRGGARRSRARMVSGDSRFFTAPLSRRFGSRPHSQRAARIRRRLARPRRRQNANAIRSGAARNDDYRHYP